MHEVLERPSYGSIKYLNPNPDLRRDEELQKGYSDEVKEPKNVGLRSMFRNKNKKINIMNYHSAPIPGVPWVCFPLFFLAGLFAGLHRFDCSIKEIRI
jgi:hypothetical protein